MRVGGWEDSMEWGATCAPRAGHRTWSHNGNEESLIRSKREQPCGQVGTERFL